MHNNALIIERFALELGQRINDLLLTKSVSTSSEEIHLLFGDSNYLQINFTANGTLFMVREAQSFPKRKTITQFKDCIGQQVRVIQHSYNRSFALGFSNNLELNILCYGRHNGILETKEGSIQSTFKLANVGNFMIEQQLVAFPSTLDEFVKQNRFIAPEQVGMISHDAYAKDPKAAWQYCQHQIAGHPLYICDQGHRYEVALKCSGNPIKSSTSAIEVLNDFARLQLSRSQYRLLKDQLVSQTHKELNKAQKRLQSVQKRLEALSTEKSKKEIGDIIMANLHAIEQGVHQVQLFDFYDNKDIIIKLNVKLSPQENAERFYKKAKNAHIERDILLKNVNSLTAKVNQLQDRLNRISTIQSFRELQQFQAEPQSSKPKSNTSTLPYKEVDFKGFKIWIGKDARANDALLKLLSRHDIWLHARGVAGSHVVIKNAVDKLPPEEVLEYAAGVAAWHSKSKNDSLAAVIYTWPKYVRKFKGALPGQVRVDREEVLLVEPLRP